MEKTLIKNAKIYDGSGKPAFFGDVLIEGERIAQIAASIPVESEYKVVDLNGLSLAPGFIDAHSHNDWFALRGEPVKYFINSLFCPQKVFFFHSLKNSIIKCTAPA